MKNRYPTPEELYALERNAHRLRAAEMARLLRAGFEMVRRLLPRPIRVQHPKGVKGLHHA